MAHNYYHNEGYTKGGLDVVTGVHLIFTGLLLFPVFVLAAFVGLTMMKHVLFNGIPVMNSPSEEQREAIRERDSEISSGNSGWQLDVPEVPVLPEKSTIEEHNSWGDNPSLNTVSNCPVGHPMRNVIGANGLPWVCASSEHQFYSMDDNYTAQ